jgi:hypothetical protein
MNQLSNQTKEEILHALEGKKSGLFIIDGKAISVELENFDAYAAEDEHVDLAQEIEEYPELKVKASLQRYMDNPNMKRYTASELLERPSEKRK